MASATLIAIIFIFASIVKGENKYYLIRGFRQQRVQRTLISSKNLWEDLVKIITRIIYFRKSFSVKLLSL